MSKINRNFMQRPYYSPKSNLKNVFCSNCTTMSRANKAIKPLWRNWLARSAVNRKAGGSSPPRGATTEIYVCFVHFLQLYSFLGYFTLLEVSNVMDSLLFGLLLYSVSASLRRDTTITISSFQLDC